MKLWIPFPRSCLFISLTLLENRNNLVIHEVPALVVWLVITCIVSATYILTWTLFDLREEGFFVQFSLYSRPLTFFFCDTLYHWYPSDLSALSQYSHFFPSEQKQLIWCSFRKENPWILKPYLLSCLCILPPCFPSKWHQISVMLNF